MFLSCSYNFFNGEEHLIASLKSVRNNIDYITLVYQLKSNKGSPISKDALEAISYAKNNKLIDNLYIYTPNFSISPQENERNKRIIGLELAKSKGCTHFFSIDADEFYYDQELKFAKDFIEKNKIEKTFCHSYMHLKSPRYRCLDTTNVCFINKINRSSQIGNFPCTIPYVDPTRIIYTKQGVISRLFKKDVHLFSTNQIAMYHMNFVRADNLKSKLNNTSTNDTNFLATIKTNVENWKPGDIFSFPGKGEFCFSEVKNDFNTFDNYSI